ncbi:MFS transporter [Streptomyces cacaoi]|uniref:Major facilitator superfamily (MFS) profile domain-containing protein n=1 Tax=Streptomyces cacaoi TaxID=1898 RepID=A0A4Y3QYV2_STRCI|nr:MFS transporter [Streptomyces cacaoi]NNG83741.1 MFS transporter [Streptomyces cacaoi]GEB49120.1 hypothetical protein SCA03_16710 [Streptomyces cacaoi]
MDTTTERARRGALLGLAAGVFCIQWDAFALNLALPQIRHELDAGGTGVQWVISSYLLTTGMLMLGAGRLADLFGRRRLFVLGLVVFGAASTLCALAWSLPALVAFRAVQGVGASMIMPAGLSLVTHVYTGHRPGRAIGWALGLGGAATACGPVAGGWLTEALSWRAVFWLNVPLTALAALWSRRAAESRDDGTPRHLDWPGLLTATAGLGALALFLDRGSGWPLLPALSTPTAAVLLLVLFVRIQRDSPHPVVRLALFRNLPYVVLTLTGAVANTALVLLLFLVPLSLQSEWGLPAGEAGAAFLAPTAAIALAGPLAGRVPPRRAAPVTAACLTVGAVALGGLAGAGALGRVRAVSGLGGGGRRRVRYRQRVDAGDHPADRRARTGRRSLRRDEDRDHGGRGPRRHAERRGHTTHRALADRAGGAHRPRRRLPRRRTRHRRLALPRIFVRHSRRVTATAATAPESAKPATGSPAARFSMPSPTSRTVPAVSLPMTTGSGRGSVSAR